MKEANTIQWTIGCEQSGYGDGEKVKEVSLIDSLGSYSLKRGKGRLPRGQTLRGFREVRGEQV